MNEVYNIDCMQHMKDIPNKYYELAIVDPPYGVFDIKNKQKEKSKGFEKRLEKAFEWDVRPDKKYFDELIRISKIQIIFGANYFLDLLPYSKNFIVWDKKNPFPKKFNDFEMIYISSNVKTKSRIFFYLWIGYSRKNWNDSKTIHCCQKPIALYRWLLENYAKPNDKIFDSHVGSGSSRIACYELGFDFIGCELDRDYWEAQEKRFKLEKARIDNKFYLPENDLFKDIL